MRKLKLILTFVILSIAYFQNIAASNSDVIIPENNNEQNKNNHGRPKLPSRKGVRCSYSSTHIEIQFPEDISMMTVSIYNDNETIWYGILTKEVPSADLPKVVGEYSIECFADNGKTYSCILNFQDF